MKAELYWVEAPWQGRLAIAPRPRGGDWLEDEVRAWRQSGVEVVVSLLTDSEIAEFDLGREEAYWKTNGIPIPLLSNPRQRCAFVANGYLRSGEEAG